MDSLSQFVLGAAVCAAAMRSRVSGRRSALWGGVVATLPDLDVLIHYGDAIANMTMHRGFSHALVCLTVASPVIAFIIAGLQRSPQWVGRWCWAVWLVLVTHVLLDALTIYGTRLWLPFVETPVAVGSVFVVDPLYTLPLLAATCSLLFGRDAARQRRWTWWGIGLSTAYLVWGLAAHTWVRVRAERALASADLVVRDVVVSAAPLQTLLWRVVAVSKEHFHVAYVSVLDGDVPVEFCTFDRGSALLAMVAAHPGVRQLRGLAGHAVGARRDGDELLVFDLRIGIEPDFVFTFAVAKFDGDGGLHLIDRPESRAYRPRLGEGLAWLWRRIGGERVAPP